MEWKVIDNICVPDGCEKILSLYVSMSQYHIIMYKLPSGVDMDGWMLYYGVVMRIWGMAHFKGCDIIYINIS